MRVSETRHKTNVIESGKGIILQSTIPVTSLVPQLSLGSNLWVLSSPQPPNLTTYREKKNTTYTQTPTGYESDFSQETDSEIEEQCKIGSYCIISRLTVVYFFSLVFRKKKKQSVGKIKQQAVKWRVFPSLFPLLFPPWFSQSSIRFPLARSNRERSMRDVKQLFPLEK